MKKSWIVWPAIILVMACGIALLVRRSPVSQALADVAARGEPTTIDIATIASFEWDKLYIFEPYTSPERVEQYLGFRWPQASMYSVKDGKDAALFVFVKGQKVVHAFRHSRALGDFSPVANPNGYKHEEARFGIQYDTGRAIAYKP
jgi:hypothetical protein